MEGKKPDQNCSYKVVKRDIPYTAPSRLSLTALADELGFLKADIGNLTAREKALKAEVARRQRKVIEGNYWRVTLSRGSRETLDRDKLEKKLGKAIIARYYVKISNFVTVKVAARMRDQIYNNKKSSQGAEKRVKKATGARAETAVT